MRRTSAKASKSVSQSGSKKTVTVRVSNGVKTVSSKTTLKTGKPQKGDMSISSCPLFLSKF